MSSEERWVYFKWLQFKYTLACISDLRDFPHRWLEVNIVQKGVSEQWLEQFLGEGMWIHTC